MTFSDLFLHLLIAKNLNGHGIVFSTEFKTGNGAEIGPAEKIGGHVAFFRAVVR